MKQELELHKRTIKDLQEELEKLKIHEVQNSQHWNTIRLLFADETEKIEVETPSSSKSKSANVSRVSSASANKKLSIKSSASEKSPYVAPSVVKVNKSVQVCPDVKTFATNTENDFPKNIAQEDIERPSPMTKLQVESPMAPESPLNYKQKSLDAQLKQAMILANTRSVLLIETENRLSEAQGRIKALEKNLEEKDALLRKAKEEVDNESKKEEHRRDDSILSVRLFS